MFAVATVFNMSMLNDNASGDVSLDAVSAMAQALEEGDSNSTSSSYNCVNDVTYGGLGFFRQCSSCTWAWFAGGFSDTGKCTK